MKFVNKENMFHKVKSDMNYLLTEMKLDEVEKAQEKFMLYFDFIRSMNNLPVINEKLNIPPKYTLKKKNEEPNTSELISYSKVKELTTTEDTEKMDETTYEFERKVRGGIVLGLDNGYLIPEKMVQDMGVEHGDKLQISGMRDTGEKMMYWFNIIEKVAKPVPNRIEYKFCPVEKDFGELIVKKSYQSNIRVDDTPFTFIINQQDVITFGLSEGDVIDVAFYKDYPTTSMKVVNKHQAEELIDSSETLNGTNNENTKKRVNIQSNENKEKKFHVEEKIFKDRKVLVIGGFKRKADYQEALEGLGAEFEAASGDEQKVRLEAMITKAEVVALTIGECSHDASTYTVNICKKKGIPFSSTNRNGVQSVVMCVEDAIKKGLEKDKFKVS